MSQGRLARSILALMVGCLFVRHASAGNEANFVLYDHHTDEKGETEVNVFGDFSNAVGDEPRYSAQLFASVHSPTGGRLPSISKATR